MQAFVARLGNDMWKRTKTGGILVALVALIAFFDYQIGAHHLVWLVTIFGIGFYIARYEWPRLLRKGGSWWWDVYGMLYTCIGPTLCASWLLKHAPMWLMWSAILTALADTAANIGGRLMCGPKLMPRFSPNKTWSGLLTALLCCSLASWYFATPYSVPGAMLVALAATAGDMFQSWLKRRAGLKDCGDILPGMGGLFDRFDGHIAAIYLTAVMAVLTA